MKKLVVVLLVAVFAVLALTACNNSTKKPEASTPAASSPSSPSTSGPTGTTAAPETTAAPTPDNTTFDTRNEDVYVFNAPGGLKLRTTNNFNIDNAEHIVVNGTKLKRIGVGIEDPAVSKVVYNDKEYFCGSKYLTTEVPADPSESTAASNEPVVFEPVNETVYVKTGYEDGKITVYSEAYKGWSSTNKKNVVNDLAFTEGMALTRTGVCYEDENDREVGWSRIEYNGKTYYTRLAYLTTVAPGAENAATTAPADTTAAPAETTAAPAETTAAPAETTAAPAGTN
jgi:hypothetical protein